MRKSLLLKHALAGFFLLGLETVAVSADRVVTALSVIYPGQTVTSDMLKVVELKREMPKADHAVQTMKDIVGQVATRTILPNRLIFPSALAPPDLVTSGDRVIVKFSRGLVSISLAMTALEDGTSGEIIRVRNSESGRIVFGKIGSDGTIRIGDGG